MNDTPVSCATSRARTLNARTSSARDAKGVLIVILILQHHHRWSTAGSSLTSFPRWITARSRKLNDPLLFYRRYVIAPPCLGIELNYRWFHRFDVDGNRIAMDLDR